MLAKLRIVFVAALCALALLLGWQNMRLQSRVAELELNGAAGALDDQLPKEAHTLQRDPGELEINERQTRELMRLRAEMTRLKSLADDSRNNSREPATELATAQPRLPEQTAETGNGLEGQPIPEGSASSQALEVTGTWGKVKISQAGTIILNNEPIDLEAFAAECERVKSAGLGFVLFVDTTGALNAAQIEAMQTLAKAQVPMRAVATEDEL